MWALSRLSFPCCQTFLSAHRPPSQTHSVSQDTVTHPPPHKDSKGPPPPPPTPDRARPGLEGRNSRVGCKEYQDPALPKHTVAHTAPLLTSPPHPHPSQFTPHLAWQGSGGGG